MELQKEKNILTMLYAIAKLFCVCQEQVVNIQYDIHFQCNKQSIEKRSY